MKRMFFSADAHGSNYVWRKWVNVPKFHKADILLLCGDLTGKALIPLIEQDNGTWTSHYFGRKWTFRSEAEMKDDRAGQWHMDIPLFWKKVDI